MSKKLKVLLKRVSEEPEIVEIEDTLEAKQELVDGLIELVSVMDDVFLICNEEGKLIDLPPNLVFDYDYIAGDCFFVGDDYKNAGFKNLTEEQIVDVKKFIEKHKFENFYLRNGLDEER